MPLTKLSKVLAANLKVAILVIKKLGFINAVRATVVDLWFDFSRGIETKYAIDVEDLELPVKSLENIAPYRPTFISCIKEALNYVSRYINFSNGGFVDIGCGKGKVLLVASDYDFQYITGVELSEKLVNICKKNIEKVNLKDRIDVQHADARSFVIQERNVVYYLFNPFQKEMLSDCLANIVTNKHRSEKIFFIYVNPADEATFSKYAVKLEDFRTRNGLRTQIYEATPLNRSLNKF